MHVLCGFHWSMYVFQYSKVYNLLLILSGEFRSLEESDAALVRITRIKADSISAQSIAATHYT